jgi:hypothetical protein
VYINNFRPGGLAGGRDFWGFDDMAAATAISFVTQVA